jgi:Ca2+-binding RTX toxin-like protein
MMRGRRPRALRPGAERLDTRVLPAAAVLSGGVLNVVGTNDPDLIQIRQAGGAIYIVGTPIVSGSRVFSSIPASAVRQISIQGLGGNDLIDLNSGGVPGQQPLRVRAWVDAGDGNDSVLGGAGNDTLFGGGGDDIVLGLGGNDQIHGGEGNDLLSGGAGNDNLNGGNGNDALFGDNGNDSLNGGDGHDSLLGGAGNDLLRDMLGNNALSGDPGNDTLIAGNGNDSLWGGPGRDVLAPGGGTNVVTQDGTPGSVSVWTAITTRRDRRGLGRV